MIEGQLLNAVVVVVAVIVVSLDLFHLLNCLRDALLVISVRIIVDAPTLVNIPRKSVELGCSQHFIGAKSGMVTNKSRRRRSRAHSAIWASHPTHVLNHTSFPAFIFTVR